MKSLYWRIMVCPKLYHTILLYLSPGQFINHCILYITWEFKNPAAMWAPPFIPSCLLWKSPHSHLTTQDPALNYGSDQYVLLEKLNQGMWVNSPSSCTFLGEGGEKTDQERTERKHLMNSICNLTLCIFFQVAEDTSSWFPETHSSWCLIGQCRVQLCINASAMLMYDNIYHIVWKRHRCVLKKKNE